MIIFEHVYKTYPNGHHALRNINFRLEKGEFTFLTGPSGAGKSTLFRLLALYDRPTSGKILVRDQEINKLDSNAVAFYRRKVGMVFQDYKLIQDRTILENVEIPLQIRNDKNTRFRSLQILDEVGILDKAEEYPMHLSGGEQQRAALARSLVHQPEILIADEPTGNLDPIKSIEMMELFEIANSRGTTVLIATHDMGLVYRMKKRTLHLDSGALKEVLPDSRDNGGDNVFF
jgi:cell division transport system ATP-binding protein